MIDDKDDKYLDEALDAELDSELDPEYDDYLEDDYLFDEMDEDLSEDTLATTLNEIEPGEIKSETSTNSDDEDDDNEEEYEATPEPKAKKSLGRIIFFKTFKILLILSIIIFVLLTALSRIAGNSETFKLGIQDFLTSASPYTARVGTLNYMRIFPNVSVHAQNIEFFDGDPESGGQSLINVGEAKIAISFFDMIFSPGHFKTIEITNLTAAPESIFNKALHLDQITVKQEGDKAFLDANGTFDNAPLNAQFGIISKGDATKPRFLLSRQRDVALKIGDITIDGFMKNTAQGDIQFENATLTHNGEDVLRGNFDINLQDREAIIFKGQGRLEPNKTQLDPRITISVEGDTRNFVGDVNSAFLNTNDFTAAAPFMDALRAITTILAVPESEEDEDDLIEDMIEEVSEENAAEYTKAQNEEFSEGASEETSEDAEIILQPAQPQDITKIAIDINFNADAITTGAYKFGNMKTKTTYRDNILDIKILNGEFIGGQMNGDITLDVATDPANLDSKMTLKNFDFTQLQTTLGATTPNLKGQGDLIIDLTSEGNNYETLLDNLDGQAGLIGRDAIMPAATLNNWSKALRKSILPTLKDAENISATCAIANIEIKSQKAISDAILINTPLASIRGAGAYNFENKTLDIVLEPKAQKGKSGNTTHLSGKLDALKTTRNKYNLSAKGFTGGADNSTLSIPMILPPNHPCKPFVIERENLLPPKIVKQ